MSDLSGTLRIVTARADSLAIAADTLDALDAAEEMRDQLHLDLCGVYEGQPCSCGVPRLIRSLWAWFAVRRDLVSSEGATEASGA